MRSAGRFPVVPTRLSKSIGATAGELAFHVLDRVFSRKRRATFRTIAVRYVSRLPALGSNARSNLQSSLNRRSAVACVNSLGSQGTM